MRLLLLIFSCWHAVAFAQDFYFPDQIPAKANAQSQAWTDADGNSHATSNSDAVAGGHGHGGDSYFEGGFNQYPPSEQVNLPISSYGEQDDHHDFAGGFDQGPSNPPYRPYPLNNAGDQTNSQANANAQTNSQGFGSKNSQSNAQASSQNFANGNTISNAISNTQTNGPNGEATASAAAAAAGVTFVNGIPIATASAAASVASTAPGAGVVHSSSSSGGPQQFGPHSHDYRDPYYGRQQYGRAPYPGGFNGPYSRPNNIYDGPFEQQWFYRSAFDKNDDDASPTDNKAHPDEISDIDRTAKRVELDKIPESKSGTVIFKD